MNEKKQRVVIVGRMNVGKSTLFNRLSTRVKSLTLDVAGVTRDFVRDIVNWQGRDFELVDSGGLSIGKPENELMQKVHEVGMQLIDSAEVVIFVVDGSVGPQPEEFEIARMLHRKKKKVVLAINKADKKEFQDHRYEFDRLGFEDVIAISAEHGIGLNDLLDAVVAALPTPKVLQEEEPAFKVVFIGRPNVGKSSLLNALLKEERAIVSPVPGTTREPVAEKVSFYQEDILLVDTPGVFVYVF